ncbi:hypothetical protein AXF42_Ash006105 [Apostasia shenzhenica]|uniref:Uncharacterized protein n=1 Tax=Apostasia shenzhenica TaxID=1088818 RepID=A0A2I0B085_9ASPA|nr:hypothetical protein AXF42_Ash006105 [Apostasia shenzhenica]
MQEGIMLSTRRQPPGSPEGRADDDSKTRKPTFIIGGFASKLFGFLLEHPIAKLVVTSLLLLLLLASVLAYTWLRPAVCFSSYGSFARTALVSSGADGLTSDFGSLGVPYISKGRSKEGKTVEWTTKELRKGLEEFVPIYESRPIKNNLHGMGFDHSFGLWFMARWLKPDLMIESGAFKGHSTWVLRQAMPDTPIISLSPRHPEKYLKKGPAYVDGNCTYFAGKDFVDFGSVKWGSVLQKHGVSDFSRVLVFFDDHQNELKRLKQALKVGFHHLIFEDNYDTGTGDHYSLRQICDQSYIRGGGHSCFRDSDEARIRIKRKTFWEKAVDVSELCGNGEAWWGVRGEMRDDFNLSNKAISYAEHFQNSRFVESVLDIYWDLPPVADPSLTHQTRYDPARAPDPIIEVGRFGLFRKLGLSRLEASVFNGYTQMVYVQISALVS